MIDVCSFCKKESEILDIRGRKACIKCQIEFIWDYVEGTRRMISNNSTNIIEQPTKKEVVKTNKKSSLINY
jgi:hypothetical protein